MKKVKALVEIEIPSSDYCFDGETDCFYYNGTDVQYQQCNLWKAYLLVNQKKQPLKDINCQKAWIKQQ